MTNSYGISEKTFGLYDNRETKALPNDILFAEAFYEAALKGELQTTQQEPFLLSSLQLIGKKPGGRTAGGVYSDLSGSIWFVKHGQDPIMEYLRSKVMDLLIGPLSPEVKLLIDDPNYTASKRIPGFLTEYEVMADPNHKPIVGKEELLIAMDLMGLVDRNA